MSDLIHLSITEAHERLQLLLTIGHGSWASVYLAVWDARRVALKVLSARHRQEEASYQAGCRRLWLEAQHLAACQRHKHIVALEAVLQFPSTHLSALEEGCATPYPPLALVLELSDGGSLAAAVQDQIAASTLRRYTHLQALQWGRDVAGALGFLHAQAAPAVHGLTRLKKVLLFHEPGGRLVAKLAGTRLCGNIHPLARGCAPQDAVLACSSGRSSSREAVQRLSPPSLLAQDQDSPSRESEAGGMLQLWPQGWGEEGAGGAGSLLRRALEQACSHLHTSGDYTPVRRTYRCSSSSSLEEDSAYNVTTTPCSRHAVVSSSAAGDSLATWPQVPYCRPSIAAASAATPPAGACCAASSPGYLDWSHAAAGRRTAADESGAARQTLYSGRTLFSRPPSASNTACVAAAVGGGTPAATLPAPFYVPPPAASVLRRLPHSCAEIPSPCVVRSSSQPVPLLTQRSPEQRSLDLDRMMQGLRDVPCVMAYVESVGPPCASTHWPSRRSSISARSLAACPRSPLVHGRQSARASTSMRDTSSTQGCASADSPVSAVEDVASPSAPMTCTPCQVTVVDCPEACDESDDVFTLGILLYEVTASVMLEPASDTIEQERVQRRMARGWRPPQPSSISGPLWQLIQACWSVNSGGRPSISAVCMQLDHLIVAADGAAARKAHSRFGCAIC